MREPTEKSGTHGGTASSLSSQENSPDTCSKQSEHKVAPLELSHEERAIGSAGGVDDGSGSRGFTTKASSNSSVAASLASATLVSPTQVNSVPLQRAPSVRFAQSGLVPAGSLASTPVILSRSSSALPAGSSPGKKRSRSEAQFPRPGSPYPFPQAADRGVLGGIFSPRASSACGETREPAAFDAFSPPTEPLANQEPLNNYGYNRRYSKLLIEEEDALFARRSSGSNFRASFSSAEHQNSLRSSSSTAGLRGHTPSSTGSYNGLAGGFFSQESSSAETHGIFGAFSSPAAMSGSLPGFSQLKPEERAPFEPEALKTPPSSTGGISPKPNFLSPFLDPLSFSAKRRRDEERRRYRSNAFSDSASASQKSRSFSGDALERPSENVSTPRTAPNSTSAGLLPENFSKFPRLVSFSKNPFSGNPFNPIVDECAPWVSGNASTLRSPSGNTSLIAPFFDDLSKQAMLGLPNSDVPERQLWAATSESASTFRAFSGSISANPFAATQSKRTDGLSMSGDAPEEPLSTFVSGGPSALRAPSGRVLANPFAKTSPRSTKGLSQSNSDVFSVNNVNEKTPPDLVFPPILSSVFSQTPYLTPSGFSLCATPPGTPASPVEALQAPEGWDDFSPFVPLRPNVSSFTTSASGVRPPAASTPIPPYFGNTIGSTLAGQLNDVAGDVVGNIFGSSKPPKQAQKKSDKDGASR